MDRLHELRHVEPPARAQLDDVRSQLLHEARGAAAAPRRARRRRRIAASAAALALVGGGSVAWASAQRSSTARTGTTIECGLDTFIPVESGNPVLDCHNALARQDPNVPQLRGWETPSGFVAVLPVGELPPPGSTPLPARFQVDAGIRYATDAFADTTGPLVTGCLTSRAAVTYASHQLAIAGLTGWRVVLQSPAGTAPSCASYPAVVDASTSTVQMMQGAGSPRRGTDVASRLDDLLQSQMTDGPDAQCLGASAAVALAEHDARALGIDASAITVSDGGTIGASGPRCAAPFLVPAGYFDVVVWMAPRT